MSPKQRDLVAKLVSERELPADEKGTYVLALLAGTAREPNVPQTSKIIDWLLALPRKAAAVSEDVEVPAGRYAIVHPERGHVEFFVVDKPEEGKWKGYTFVKQQASDDKYPVKGARRNEVLARIAEDPRAAMIRYGHELGCCGRCGRTLTDEVSRAMGIGPDCADAMGIPRMSEAEASEARILADAAAAAPRIEEIAREIASERTAREGMPSPAREGLEDTLGTPEPVSRDKQGVPHGVGGWRARKRYADDAREDKRAKREKCSQDQDKPGCDIFGGPL